MKKVLSILGGIICGIICIFLFGIQIGFITFTSEFFGDFKEKNRNHIFSIFKQFIEKKGQGKLIKIELSSNLSKLSKHLNKEDFIELFNLLMKENCDAVRFN